MVEQEYVEDELSPHELIHGLPNVVVSEWLWPRITLHSDPFILMRLGRVSKSWNPLVGVSFKWKVLEHTKLVHPGQRRSRLEGRHLLPFIHRYRIDLYSYSFLMYERLEIYSKGSLLIGETPSSRGNVEKILKARSILHEDWLS